MRFFKYLILLFLFSFSPDTLAYTYIVHQLNNGTFATPQSACASFTGQAFSTYTYPGWDAVVGTCGGRWILRTGNACPPVGYSAIFLQGPNGEIPTTRCMIIDGAKCKFVSDGRPPFWVTIPGHNRPSTELESASINPDPHCVDGDDGTCNSNDPYSGCYVPPNDNCVRQSDGSIYCPSDTTPPIYPTCNGATYCNRPPEGCGTGYVGGSFNGQALCVSSGSSGTGTPTQPTSTSTSSSTSTSTSTSTATGEGTGEGGTNVTNNTTTTNNNTNTTSVNIDVSGIINAITTLKNSMNPFLNEINNGVKSLNTTITGTNQKLDTANTSLNNINQNSQSTNNKLDSTNTKLDSANTSLNAINQNGQTTNAKLQELINKPTGDGNGFSDTGIINAIEDQTTQIKDFFTPDESLKTQIEAIGNESNDGRYLGSQNNASSSLQSLANAMTFSNAACVPDLELDVPIYGSVTIPLSKWCDILAIVKIFIQLAALILAFRMINDSIRSF